MVDFKTCNFRVHLMAIDDGYVLLLSVVWC